MLKSKEVRPRSPRRAVHLTGLPRFKHAHLSGGEFVFNGASMTGGRDFDLMAAESATWQTNDRKYKKLMMVQENGMVAKERHDLEDEAVDRLYYLLAERDRAKVNLVDHNLATSAATRLAMGGSLLMLDGPASTGRAQRHADVVEGARAAVLARTARGDGPSDWRLGAAKAAALEAREQRRAKAAADAAHLLKKRGEGLSVQDTNAYMRFLKEGPRRGDGAFEEPPLQLPVRLMRASMDRTYQLRQAEGLWQRKYP